MKKLIILVFFLSLPYFIYTYFFTPQRVGINEVSSSGITINKGAIKELKVQNHGLPYNPEITPLTLMQSNGQRIYVLSTAFSFLCTSIDNILDSSPTNPLNLNDQACQLITKPDIYDSYTPQNTNSALRMKFKNPAQVNQISQMTQDWKRTYDGLLSLHLLNNQLIGVRHNEHVNHSFPAGWTGESEYTYQNTVQDVPALIPNGGTPYIDAAYKYKWPTGCRSGFGVPRYDNNNVQIGQPNGYDHCWDSFQNFVSLLQIDYPSTGWTAKPNIKNPELDASIHDQGPIIWARGVLKGGYDGKGNLVNNFRATGFYQPTSFINDGYIYTFFKTVKWGGYCTGAARAAISSNGAAHTWKFFNRSTNSFDRSSLPDNFSKETIRNFYTQNFDNFSDCIVDESDTSQPQYFNVAKVRNSPYFMAVEERSYTAEGRWLVGARFSKDLINWTSLQELSSCGTTSEGSYAGWACGLFAYPTLIDKKATTNYEVDIDEFYLLGTHATGGDGYELSSMKLSLTLPLSSNPSDYNGKPIKGTTDINTVYYMEAGKRRAIPDWDTYIHGLGFKSGDEIVLPDSIINGFPMGTPISLVSPSIFNGKPIKGTTDKNTIYLVENGIKRSYPNEALFLASFTHAQVIQLSDATLSRIPSGSPLGTATKPGDLNGDGKVNLYDYSRLISGYGTIYSNTDFINILANYGK